MFAVLILESLITDGDDCLPPRVQPFAGKLAIPLSWLFKAYRVKRMIAQQATGIDYVSNLDWYLIDTRSRHVLGEWLKAWGKLDLHHTMGVWEFEDLPDFQRWMLAVGQAVDEPETFYRLVDGHKL